MSDYDRFDSVLKFMWSKHRWSINHLLHHMVTAESEKPYSRSIKTRVKRLSDAIAQERVTEQLTLHSDLFRDVFQISSVVSRLQVEINRLGSDIGLGNFNPEIPVHGLDIPHIYNRIQETAPELCKLLFGLLEPKHHSTRDRVKASQGPITIITACILYANAPKTKDNFPVLLGVYLHSMGVKRRILSVLAGLGLIPSYQTIMRKRAELTEIGKVIPLSCVLISFLYTTS